ncbi:MAG: hypothetical protein COU11_03625 [Candidatus Harrisonbacteria bacterium CG10_big_fil_rev_8_21_14_0_10_49_15]|uniref:Uncharacterized protein n=1 Tax=Candidatus Harrisonbacteria bacterium CG10_big_fil_rev_8_21_14_0_10_49_15 TaxID=1974587 RepID=A0A2H0UML1_9BACT|nr:MAG: hypothetical protein COU11_03625 [Candidatus Harrisonbacteria bacterium CG10_big_fil_rev_8_21_14_0_10_49_15]
MDRMYSVRLARKKFIAPQDILSTQIVEDFSVIKLATQFGRISMPSRAKIIRAGSMARMHIET